MDVVFDVFKKVTSAAKEVIDDTAACSKSAILKSALSSGRLNSNDIKKSLQFGIAYFYRTANCENLRSVILRNEFSSCDKRVFRNTDGYIPPDIPSFDLEACGLNGFRRIMLEYGLTPDVIADSLMSGDLREYANPAKSGSLFYLTNDDEFIIKTVRDYEARFFLSDLLSDYYHNLAKRKMSFLARYFGLFGYTQQASLLTLRFTVMSNIIPSSISINEKFDLKGSTKGRQASVSERLKSSPTLKDLDFLELHPIGITLPPAVYDRLKEIISDDVEILKGWNVIDYSLLLGICNLDNSSQTSSLCPVIQSLNNAVTFSSSSPPAPAPPHSSFIDRSSSFGPFYFDCKQKYNSPMKRLFSDIQSMCTFDHSIAKKYGGIPARNEKGERLILFLGIIDILQTYDTGKQVQNYIQSMNADDEVQRSIVEPNLYADRFLCFIFNRVFVRGFDNLGTVNLTELFSLNSSAPANNASRKSSVASHDNYSSNPAAPTVNHYSPDLSNRPLHTFQSTISSPGDLPYPTFDTFPTPQHISATSSSNAHRSVLQTTQYGLSALFNCNNDQKPVHSYTASNSSFLNDRHN